MPIHDQGYRPYLGTRAGLGQAWRVIARTELRSALRSRRFIALLVAAWLPFAVRSAQIYFSSSFAEAAFLRVTTQTFRQFLDFQSLFVFLVTIALAGSIADDRRAGALLVFLSRPLTRVEYVAGKLAPVLVYLLGVTFLPAVLLLLLQMALSGSWVFLRQNLFLLPAITLVSFVEAVVSSCAMLALSSLSKSRRLVAVMYAAIIFFTGGLYQALRVITGSTSWAVISPGEMLDVIADAAFRLTSRPPVSAAVAALVIVGLVGASLWVLDRRVRAVEIVT
jgi:ABC-2 type transport system permease protein